MFARRNLLQLIALAPVAAAAAHAQGFGQFYALDTDDGQMVPNFKVPASLDPAALRGVVRAGAKTPDVTIYEYFDYNCPFCRAASVTLDEMLRRDPDLQLALVNNPILSLGSVQAAKIQQAVLRRHGDAAAYRLHKALFAQRGHVDGPAALGVAKGLGFDPAELEFDADSKPIADVLGMQLKNAANLGLSTTPSFIVDGVGMTGWPGPRTMASVVASVRRCDRLVCTPEKG